VARNLLSIILVCVLAAVSSGCTPNRASNRRLAVVASFYPLAWVAEQVGGRRVVVDDLTPPGGEPHDLSISARQRSEVMSANVIVLIGGGFQPQVESSARQSKGRVVDVGEGLTTRPSNKEGLVSDPHFWLDPISLARAASRVADAFGAVDPAGRAEYERGASRVGKQLDDLDLHFRAGLSHCRYSTLIVTHEAFGYLAARYGLQQLGVTGLTPEAEPSATSLQEAAGAVRDGKAGAVFFEESDEGRRVGTSVAGDIGVPALSLHTLESDPAPADYIATMERNLDALKRGLRCAT
jgi:zinc transport system substrate-binding protein